MLRDAAQYGVAYRVAMDVVDLFVEMAGRWLGGMQRRLSEVQYLAGTEFTVADVLFTTVLQIVDAGVVARYPALVDCRRRCEARPAWQRTLDHYKRRLNLVPGAARR